MKNKNKFTEKLSKIPNIKITAPKVDINLLIQRIKDLNGEKILNLFSEDSINQYAEIGMSVDGKFLNEDYQPIFMAKLFHAISRGGELTVVQIDELIAHKIYLGNDTWKFVSFERIPEPEENIAVNNLIKIIEKIPGNKIITLVFQTTTNYSGEERYDISSNHIKMDLDENGVWGYMPSHLDDFKGILEHALATTGGMMIRRFLKTNAENGFPRKILYGVSLAKGEWHPIPSDQLQINCETDNKTKKPIPTEEGVIYGDFADFVEELH